MDCQDVRPRLLDYQRNRLPPELHDAVRAHLDGCQACVRAEAGERTLSDVLETRMPQHPASLALKRRLAAEWPTTSRGSTTPAAPPGWWSRWGRSLVPALAVAVVLVAALPLYQQLGPAPPGGGTPSVVAEAVNDHLRVLASQHPLDIQSGGIHQVKPWFEGRLDFAPVVSFEGDAEFTLEGGAVGYFLDRKAAVFVYRRRLHAISLLVVPAGGLAWPERGLEPIDGIRAYRTTARGFNVVLWRVGGFGYALVSDVDAAELSRLAPKIAGGA
jgi:anti-sigma factor RsiW